MKNPDLSIVIVEYHCLNEVAACVATLREHLRDLSWEGVVVSNSRYGASRLETMRERLPGIRIIATERNLGYAGGVNRALPECRAPFLFVLNPDGRLIDGCLSKLISFLERTPHAGMVAPRLLDDGGETRLPCRRFPRPWTFVLVRTPLRKCGFARKEVRRYLMLDIDPHREIPVDWVSGGSMLVRREALAEVGPMDERYFLYMEDVDWCRRFWAAGWSVWYQPRCAVYHQGQHRSTSGAMRALLTPHFWIHLVSLARYFLKWGPRLPNAAPRLVGNVSNETRPGSPSSNPEKGAHPCGNT